jgi:hypothetical protein
MVLLGLWLSSVDQDYLLESILVGKILEILSKLNFTVEKLVKYKFGRVIKKITNQKDKIPSILRTNNFDLACTLFDSWNSLASKSELFVAPRRKSEDEIISSECANMVATNCKRESDKTSLSSENLFPKKIKASDSTEIDTLKQEKDKDRKVRFPDSHELLCKIIVFERAPEEYEFLSDGSASRDSYLHADIGEASIAFGHSDEIIEDLVCLKPWNIPNSLDHLLEFPDGIDCEEKIIQQQRERTVLSTSYFSIHEIPSSPSEKNVDIQECSDDQVKTIPIRANENIIRHTVKIKSSCLIIPGMLSPDLLSSLVSNASYDSTFNPFIKSDTKYSQNTQFNIASESPAVKKSKRNLCKFYKPGRASSCRLGSSCKFLHQD